jgi:hypothetical protein
VKEIPGAYLIANTSARIVQFQVGFADIVEQPIGA